MKITITILITTLVILITIPLVMIYNNQEEQIIEPIKESKPIKKGHEHDCCSCCKDPLANCIALCCPCED